MFTSCFVLSLMMPFSHIGCPKIRTTRYQAEYFKHFSFNNPQKCTRILVHKTFTRHTWQLKSAGTQRFSRQIPAPVMLVYFCTFLYSFRFFSLLHFSPNLLHYNPFIICNFPEALSDSSYTALLHTPAPQSESQDQVL